MTETTLSMDPRPSALSRFQGGVARVRESLATPWLQEILGPLEGAYKQVMWLALAINFIALFASLFSLQVYDRVIQKGGLVTLVALIIGMVFALALDQILREGRGVLLRRIGVRIEVVIAKLVYQRLTRLPALALEARPPAFWQTMFRDIELIRATTAGGIALLLVDIPFMFVTLILLAFIAWPLVPVMLVILVAFFLLSFRTAVTIS